MTVSLTSMGREKGLGRRGNPYIGAAASLLGWVALQWRVRVNIDSRWAASVSGRISG